MPATLECIAVASRYAIATSYCMLGPTHGMRQDALRHDIYFHGQKRAPSATGMHIRHVHDDKASTEFVHAPRCGLHAICVAVVITFYRPPFKCKRAPVCVRNIS